MADGFPRIGATKSEAALARRDDFALGHATVRPSIRTVEGPVGSVLAEPRVMQVLVALADAKGAVLTRDDLIRICWDGRIVGDDAVNRAIAEVRRIALAADAGFAVETVPRIGYRIICADPEDRPALSQSTTKSPSFARRKLIVGAAAIVAAAAGGAAIIYRRDHAENDALIERGRLLQGSGRPGGDEQAAVLFRQVIARDDGRADAWGWLAVVLNDSEKARDAALRAVAIDPAEPNARTVLAYQRRDLDGWTRWEDEILGVLADAPGCAIALQHLTFFYQGMGRCKDSWSANERAIRAEPFNPGHQHRRALKHWIFGRLGEANQVADQALRLWPRNSTVWNARMVIYAFTDRAPAALALLDDLASRPVNLTAPSVASWRAALEAIATRSRPDITRALTVCTNAARLAPGLAANAIMAFSHLGEIDAAYRVAEGLFEGRGPVVQQKRGGGIKDLYSGSSWGRTQFLFIPATTQFRADSRFFELCRRMGHVDYWQKRGIWPDSFVRGSLRRSI